MARDFDIHPSLDPGTGEPWPPSEPANDNVLMYIISGNICKSKSDCQTVNLQISSANAEQQPQLDYSQLADFWGVAFTSVLMLWLFSHGIGHILKLVKNA